MGAVLFAAPFAVLPLAGRSTAPVAVLAGVQFLSAAGVTVFDIHLNAVQTVVTPDRMRSRRTGVFGTINYGIRPIGATLGGVTAGLVGIEPVIIAAAIGGTAAVFWLLGSPVLRVAEPVNSTGSQPDHHVQALMPPSYREITRKRRRCVAMVGRRSLRGPRLSLTGAGSFCPAACIYLTVTARSSAVGSRRSSDASRAHAWLLHRRRCGLDLSWTPVDAASWPTNRTKTVHIHKTVHFPETAPPATDPLGRSPATPGQLRHASSGLRR